MMRVGEGTVGENETADVGAFWFGVAGWVGVRLGGTSMDEESRGVEKGIGNDGMIVLVELDKEG